MSTGAVDDLRTQLISGLHKAVRVDVFSSTVTYIGFANIGTANASALWQIARITVAATVTSIEWAGLNRNFDKIWNNRTSLTYG